MKYVVASFMALLALVACAVGVNYNKPSQRIFAAGATLSEVQHTIQAYADQCETVEIKAGCDETVDDLQLIEAKAFSAYESAYDLYKAGNGSGAELRLKLMEKALEEARNLLAREAINHE